MTNFLWILQSPHQKLLTWQIFVIRIRKEIYREDKNYRPFNVFNKKVWSSNRKNILDTLETKSPFLAISSRNGEALFRVHPSLKRAGAVLSLIKAPAGGRGGREAGKKGHRSARTQEVRAREVCSASLAREKRSEGKLKGDEEHYGEKKRPGGGGGGGEGGRQTTVSRGNERTPLQPRSPFRGSGALLKSCSRPSWTFSFSPLPLSVSISLCFSFVSLRCRKTGRSWPRRVRSTKFTRRFQLTLAGSATRAQCLPFFSMKMSTEMRVRKEAKEIK